jgi:hypothetical protein
MCVCVSRREAVRVCVCVRARKRERERESACVCVSTHQVFTLSKPDVKNGVTESRIRQIAGRNFQKSVP